MKWFRPAGSEPDWQLAQSVIGRMPLRTTTLAYYEVGNVLTRSIGLGAKVVDSALDTMVAICGAPINLDPVDFEPCSAIANEFGVTFYDASYVAIARRTNRSVLSADSDLLDPELARDLSTAVSG
ncbi:MAG: type II toxin-antitoxin system VapC family toxin [Solirubrobacterales bacterium]|nr:type II toxin-antitoxin system VapC family toxin [Solirubrobacterales bacterium]